MNIHVLSMHEAIAIRACFCFRFRYMNLALSGYITNINFIIFSLTRLGLEHVVG
jgi:hypothetical protein